MPTFWDRRRDSSHHLVNEDGVPQLGHPGYTTERCMFCGELFTHARGKSENNCGVLNARHPVFVHRAEPR